MSGGEGRALGRIDVRACYTPGARFRQWCGWWGRRAGGGWELQQRRIYMLVVLYNQRYTTQEILL